VGWQQHGKLTYEGRGPALDEVLDWSSPKAVLAPPADSDLLGRHGLRHDPAAPWMRVNARPLAGLAEPVVPEGYRLVTMAEYEDVSARVRGHRAAWGGEVSRFTDDAYGIVRGTWPYRADLDCLAVAPDGTVACTLIAWLDERNRVGELEPVGTAPAHRRLGLASALCLFALHRLRGLGAETGLVGSRGDAAYPIPTLVYEGIGFREIARRVAFHS
jgi:GNAT superfamily N-acetyltransferase